MAMSTPTSTTLYRHAIALPPTCPTSVPTRPTGRGRWTRCSSRRRAPAPDRRFLIGGALYPADFPWTSNIFVVRHIPPAEHPAFFSSGRLTLKVTRGAMAKMGWCPSGRLFEAAACGVPILSDASAGLDAVFEPGREILVAGTTPEALAAIDLGDEYLQAVARAARARVLAEHISAMRVLDLEAALDRARMPIPASPPGRRAAEV